MKCLITLFLLFSVSGLSFAGFPDSREQGLSVWKIEGFSTQGTGFFVSPNLFVTNFHIISSMVEDLPFSLSQETDLNSKSENLQEISLSQEGSSSVLKLKRIRRVSALYDLALLEIEGEVSHYLELAEGDGPSVDFEKIISLSYPDGEFKIIEAIGDVFNIDHHTFIIFTSKDYVGGASGSPILDESGKVVGVLYAKLWAGIEVFSVPVLHLKNLIRGKIGLDCSSYGVDIRKCVVKEQERLEEMAEKGNHSAQYQLSFMIYSSNQKNDQLENSRHKREIYWLRKSAEGNNLQAQHSLGSIYLDRKNSELAIKWLEKAVEGGNILSTYLLSRIYYYEKDIEKNKELALQLLHKARENGNFRAEYLFLEMKAKKGNVSAQSQLLRMHYDKIVQMKEKDFRSVLRLLEASARKGNVSAQHELAEIYFFGKGVKRNPQLGFKWFNKATKQKRSKQKRSKQKRYKAKFHFPLSCYSSFTQP